MKTTLELPNELVRAVKVRAAQSNRKLKDLVAELIERGLTVFPAPSMPPAAPKRVRLRSGRLTIEQIESAIAAGRD
jgi:hypothetical protein